MNPLRLRRSELKVDESRTDRRLILRLCGAPNFAELPTIPVALGCPSNQLRRAARFASLCNPAPDHRALYPVARNPNPAHRRRALAANWVKLKAGFSQFVFCGMKAGSLSCALNWRSFLRSPTGTGGTNSRPPHIPLPNTRMESYDRNLPWTVGVAGLSGVRWRFPVDLVYSSAAS